MKYRDYGIYAIMWFLTFPFFFIALLGFVWQFVWSQMVGNVWTISIYGRTHQFKYFWRYKE